MKVDMADRILLWLHADTDAYTVERVDWVAPEAFHRMHYEVAKFIESQYDIFSTTFSDWFHLADFPDVLEQLEPSEVPVFLKAAKAPDGTDSFAIQNFDRLAGLCAVISHCLGCRSAAGLTRAAELFNWTIECGLFVCETSDQVTVKVGSVAEVGPFLLERIVNRLPCDAGHGPSSRTELSSFERRFRPVEPLLGMLQESMHFADWVQNPLALDIFFWIAGLYRTELEEGG